MDTFPHKSQENMKKTSSNTPKPKKKFQSTVVVPEGFKFEFEDPAMTGNIRYDDNVIAKNYVDDEPQEVEK